MRSQHFADDTVIGSRLLLPKLWQRLSPILFKNRSRVGLAVLCLLGAKVALMYIPFLLKALVDGLETDPNQLAIQAILILVLAYGAARLTTTLFGEIRDTLFGRVTEKAMHEISLSTFKHVHSLDLEYHLNRRTGGLARDIERGTDGISFLLRFFIFNIAPTLIEIAMVAIILWVNYGAQYALVVLLSVMAYSSFSFRATSWRTQYVREVNRADSDSQTRAVDSLLNYETVKYFNNEPFEAGRYDIALDIWEQARRKNRLSLFALNAGQALIIAVSQTLMLGMAALSVGAGDMSLGDFILINQFMLQLFLPLGFLGFVYREIKAALANIERLFNVLEERPSITPHSAAPDLALSAGDIQFRHIEFAYSESEKVLKDFSLHIKGGQTVALVGVSGAGKSTVSKLLFRFYDPTQGVISIDGTDIKEINLPSLRKAIAVVPQDCVLFNDSLRENIRYGRPAATDSDIEQAVKAAHLAEFVERLPAGLDTLVGERGLKISGGERQRVAIARAVLKQAHILIFDEATSSLDSHSEQAVLKAFKALAGRQTTLVIAHRLSTIVDADQIVVMHAGSVVEQGTHSALLDASGKYAALWRAQLQEHR
ncbi:ABC transporter ATP-binding protein/permease [Luminiphilus sp.]|nr:ABC transporter ATP-binding protein/permease [Luminiphilus sp.]MDA9797770.1 ABC transporter ATP-binding protein/permease [Luminiphilus sp.]|tara:strand:- start:5592 stop:7385 length:1794 start_codon:yes stop_codon:yes gene_type:complete